MTSRRACRASSACRGSPARPARRRSRTSAPTGRRSPRRSSPCACSTAPAARSPSCRRRVRLRLPPQHLQVPRPPRVLAVTFRMRESATVRPAALRELARTLDVPVGGSAPLAEVREAVLGLRRGKGMVIDPADPDSVSAGSFFTNPILDPATSRACRRARASRPARVPGARRPDQDLGRLADRARRLPARLRRRRRHLAKHTLALVNRGGATAELMALARRSPPACASASASRWLRACARGSRLVRYISALQRGRGRHASGHARGVAITATEPPTAV